MNAIVDRIFNRIQTSLPGEEAHALMMTTRRASGALKFKKREETRICAVAILLYPDEHGNLHFPVILRPPYEGILNHGGQIALPGGGRELIDRNLEETARREFLEEVGVSLDKANTLGVLSDLYIQPSDSLVTPYILYQDHKPTFNPNPKEVDKIFEIPLDKIWDPNIRKRKTIRFEGNEDWDMPYFDLFEKELWGATAMIISELAHISSPYDLDTMRNLFRNF